MTSVKGGKRKDFESKLNYQTQKQFNHSTDSFELSIEYKYTVLLTTIEQKNPKPVQGMSSTWHSVPWNTLLHLGLGVSILLNSILDCLKLSLITDSQIHCQGKEDDEETKAQIFFTSMSTLLFPVHFLCHFKALHWSMTQTQPKEGLHKWLPEICIFEQKHWK